MKNEPFAFERMAHRMLQEALEQRVNALPQGGARTVSQIPRKEAEVQQYYNPARRKTLVRLKVNMTSLCSARNSHRMLLSVYSCANEIHLIPHDLVGSPTNNSSASNLRQVFSRHHETQEQVTAPYCSHQGA